MVQRSVHGVAVSSDDGMGAVEKDGGKRPRLLENPRFALIRGSEQPSLRGDPHKCAVIYHRTAHGEIGQTGGFHLPGRPAVRRAVHAPQVDAGKHVIAGIRAQGQNGIRIGIGTAL